MKRVYLVAGIAALVILSLLSLNRSNTASTSTTGACSPVTDNMKKELARYVHQKLKMPTAMSLQVAEVSPVENSCYSKLRFASADSPQPAEFELYLSPDHRFLTRDLVDTSVDPAQAELKLAEQVRVGSSEGKFASLGSKEAPVTITVFSDFQCPFCKNAAQFLHEAAKSEGDTVRLVFRHLPLRMHAWAVPAAEATACAQVQSDEAFWKLHDMLFENQKSITAENIQSRLGEFATTVPGLDLKRFQACVANRETSAAVKEDIKFATDNEISGTPTIFVNGFQVKGVRSAEQLREVVRQHAAGNRGGAPSE
jgi:protein-disulfide isomerase